MDKVLHLMWVAALCAVCAGGAWAQGKMAAPGVDATLEGPAEFDGGQLALLAVPTDLDPVWAKELAGSAPADEVDQVLVARIFRGYTASGGDVMQPAIYSLASRRRIGGASRSGILRTYGLDGELVAVGNRPHTAMFLSEWMETIRGASFGEIGNFPGESQVPRNAYFIGDVRPGGGGGNIDMGVVCVRHDFNKLCPGWPTVSLGNPELISAVSIPFELSPGAQEAGTRIEFLTDGFTASNALFGIGVVLGAGTDGGAVGVFKLHASDGSLDTSFGNGGKAVYYVGRKSRVLASTVVDGPSGPRLVVGGSIERDSPADRDGYVLVIDPATGNAMTKILWYESDNSGYKIDEVTALAATQSGKIVFAGYSETDDAGYPALLLGRFDGGIAWDANFCGGGMCAIPQKVPSLVYGTKDIRPRAMTVEPTTGDLLLALDGERWDDASGNWYRRQLVDQYSSNGLRFRGRREIPYAPAPGVDEYGTAGAVAVRDRDVIVGGQTRIEATVSRGTLARFARNDSIFASDFGGTYSD